MSEEINRLINEYKETEKCLILGIEWLPNNDFARAKLDVVKVIINDLEKLKEKLLK